MSLEDIHKLMGFYMENFNTRRLVHGFCFFKLFPIGCIGLRDQVCRFVCSHRLPVDARLILYLLCKHHDIEGKHMCSFEEVAG